MSRPAPPGVLDWAGVVLVTLSGALSAFIETLLVPLYVGSVIAPVSVVLALVGNVGLPRMAHVLVPRTAVALLPFLGWLAVIVGFGVLTRPEGDVILPGSPTAAEFVTYALLGVGVIAGTATIVALAPPPAVRGSAGRPPTADRNR